MDRISINLLPPSLKENKLLTRKKKLINRICISILGILVFITISLIGTSVYQNTLMASETEKLTALTNALNAIKEKEAAVVILKKRLATISQIQKKQFPQTDSFLLITSLLPTGTQMQSFSADQSNIVSLAGIADDAETAQMLFDNLTDPVVMDGKVGKTTISNLNRGSAPRMIFDLQIATNLSTGSAIKK